MPHDPAYHPLLTLLQRRRTIIADHGWRDRDAKAHLSALQEVSESIMAEHLRLSHASLPPRLKHYLTQCSYQKAMDWIESGGGHEE